MMITAFAIGLSTEVKAHFNPILELPIPSKGKVVFGPFDPETKNITFTTPYAGSQSKLYLLQFKQKSILYLGIIYGVTQQDDCGAGIFEVSSPASRADRYLFFHRFIDGKQIGGLPWHLEDRRVGLAVQQKDKIVDLNGNLLATNIRPPNVKSNPNYLGPLFWNGKRRLSIVGRGDTTGDVKDVVELNNVWKKGKRHLLSTFAMRFDHMVGNPDTGAFAIYERNNREVTVSTILNKNFQQIGSTEMNIIDIGPRGIIVAMQKMGAIDWYGTGEVRCLDPVTGKIKWRGKNAGSWIGNYLIQGGYHRNRRELWQGQLILSGKSGKPVGKMPLAPTGALNAATDGNYCYSISMSNSLVVYKLTFK